MRTSIVTLLLLLLHCAMGWAITPSASLPVLYINTENSANINSRDTYINATYYIDPNDNDNVAPIGSVDNQLPMSIRGRGNYTWTGFDKKPYRIKLDKKAALLGMAKNKHFALLAHADDNRGFMRNAIGLQLSRLIGLAWTPDDKPVEVVLNGNYIGLYFLTETIRVDSNRVNIIEQIDNTTNTDSISGGWLVEIDNYDTDPHISVYEGDNSGYKINFTYKSPEQLSGAQSDYLKSQMSQINSLIYASDKSHCKWADMVDIDDLARYYIVQELVDDYESFHGSCFMYKNHGDNEKWHFGPVWDFGSALNYDKSQFIYQGREHHQVWIEEMCKFPLFINKVKTIWADFVASHYNDIMAYINDYRDNISSAATTDAQRWPQYGNADINSRVLKSKKRLKGAFEWLCSQWGGAIPDDSTDEDAVVVYFIDDDASPWTNLHAYAWDSNGELLSRWPGTPMTATTIGGKAAWKISFTPNYQLSDNVGLIFNNSHSGAGNQTADLILVNGGVYNRNGIISDVDATPTDSNDLIMYMTPGGLTVTCREATNITVARIDGAQFTITAPAGTSTHNLARGVYVINGKKFLR